MPKSRPKRRRTAVMPANPQRDAYIDGHVGDTDTNSFLCNPKR